MQVEAGFNKETRRYEVKSVQGCKKFQQVFINYGPHDNHRLLLEYGFVASGNPQSVVYVDLGKENVLNIVHANNKYSVTALIIVCGYCRNSKIVSR